MDEATQHEFTLVRRDIAKIWNTLSSLKTVLFGPDESDGLRTDVEEQGKAILRLEEKCAACPGRKEAPSTNPSVQCAEIETKGKVSVAQWEFLGIIVVQIASIVVLLIKLK